MKKITTILLVFFAAILLVACGEVKPPGPTPPNGGDNKPKTVYLQYADWNRTEVNYQLLDAFMEKYPHIKVTWTEIGGSGAEFTGNLITAAQQDALPDVFAIDNVPTVVANGLTLDVAQYWDADEDAKLVYENIAKTAVYNGKRYAIPSFQFMKGIFINLTMFDNLNLQTVAGKYRIDPDTGYPVKNWTHSEMVELAKAVTSYDLNNIANFRLGLGTWFGNPDFQQVWPMIKNVNMGYDTYDYSTGKFNYNDSSWIEAMKASVELMDATKNPGVCRLPEYAEGSPEREKQDQIVADIGWAIATGYQAMAIDGSWNFGAVNQAKQNNQQLGFWPYPRGSKDGELIPPTILDYTVVSSLTNYPEEAYLLAKWMSYGKDGWEARMDITERLRETEIAENTDISHIDRWPIANYPEVWNRIKALMVDKEGNEYIPGLMDSINSIGNAKPDLDKWLAGYKDFWVWTANADNPYSRANLYLQGRDAVPTFANEWNKKINELVSLGVEFGELPPPEETPSE